MTTRIVTFTNAAYLPVLRNWLAALTRLGLDQAALVMTLDDTSRSALEGVVETRHRPLPSDKLNDLWVHRTEVLAELLDEDLTVIHSDTDAVWLQDPLPDFFAGAEDMVFSQGTIWPPESYALRGFVLCCGLFGLRPTRKTRAFVGAWIERVREVGDDQQALNRMVDERWPDWTIVEPYRLVMGDKPFVCSRTRMTAQSADGMKLAVLPHHRFPRLVTDVTEAYVAHPLSGKTLEETRAALSALRLWTED